MQPEVVDVPCPYCTRIMRIPPQAFGRSLACPHCGGVFSLGGTADGAGVAGWLRTPGGALAAVGGGVFVLLLLLTALLSRGRPAAEPPRVAHEVAADDTPPAGDEPVDEAAPPLPGERLPAERPSRRPRRSEPREESLPPPEKTAPADPKAAPADPGVAPAASSPVGPPSVAVPEAPNLAAAGWRGKSPLLLTSDLFGRTLAIAEASGDGKGCRVGIWSTAGVGRELRAVELPSRPDRLILSPDGRRIAASWRKGQSVLWCWDRDGTAEPVKASAKSDCVAADWHFTPDGTRLIGKVFAGADFFPGKVRPEGRPVTGRIEWNIAENRLAHPVPAPGVPGPNERGFALPSRPGAYVYRSDAWDESTVVLRLRDGRREVAVPAARDADNLFTSDPAGRLLLSVGEIGTVRSWPDGRELFRVDPEAAEPAIQWSGADEVRFSPDGRWAMWYAGGSTSAEERPERSAMIRFDIEGKRGHYLPGFFVGMAYLSDGTLVVGERPPSAAAPSFRFPAAEEFRSLVPLPDDPLIGVQRPTLERRTVPDPPAVGVLPIVLPWGTRATVTADGRTLVGVGKVEETGPNVPSQWRIDAVDLATGKPISQVQFRPPYPDRPGDNHQYGEWTISPTGRWAAIVEREMVNEKYTERECLLLIDLQTKTDRRLPLQDYEGHTFIGFLPGGSKMLCGRTIYGIWLIDFENRTETKMPDELMTGYAYGTRMWPDGRVGRLATNGRLSLYRSCDDILKGENAYSTLFVAEFDGANTILPSGDGRTFWTEARRGGAFEKVIRWDTAGKEPPIEFDMASTGGKALPRLRSAKVRSDGRFLVYGTFKHQLLDTTRNAVFDLPGISLGWAFDGSLVLSGPKGLHFYDPETGKYLEAPLALGTISDSCEHPLTTPRTGRIPSFRRQTAMQAAVEVPCPHCFRGLGVPPEAFGRMLACPHCGGTLTFAGPQGESHGSGRTIVAVIGGGLLLLIGLAAVVSLRMPPEVAQPPREAVEAETEPPEAGVPRRTDRPHRIAEPPQPEENETEPTAPPSREPPVAEPPSREPPSAVPFDPGPPDGGPTDWRKRSPLRLTSNVGGSVVALAEAAGEGSRVGLWSTNGGGRAGRSVVLPFRPERLILAPEGRRVAASGRLRQDHVLWCWDASDPAPPRTAVVDANCIPSHWHFTPDAARLVGAVGPGENSPAQPEIPRKRRIEWNLAANRLECPRATPDGSVSDGPCFFLPGRLPATVSVSEPWFSDTTTLRISAAGGKVEIPAARGDIEVFAGTSPQAGRSNLVVGVGAQGMAIDRTDGRILLRLDPEGAEPTPMQAGLDEVQFSPDARRAIWWARRPETAAGIDRPARSVLIRFDVEKQRGYFLPGHFLGAAYLADGTLVVADRPPEAAAPRLRFPADAEFVPMPFAPADPLANAVIRPVVAKEAPWPDHAVTASLEGFFGNEDLTVLTPDGRRAVCITRGREKNRWTLQVMDVADGREALRLDILPPEIEDAKPPRELVHSDLTVSPDGRRVLFSEPEYRAGNLTGRICAAIVDVEHATLRRLPVQDTVRNRFLGFSADGSKVLCRREGLDLIDLAAGTAEPVPTEFETGLIDGLSFWPDGRVVRRFPSGRLRFFRSWEALMAGTTEFDTKFIASDHQANMLRPVDGGRTVWTNLGYPSNRLVRWDLAGNRPPEVFDLSSVSADITRLSTVKASPDGRFAAFGPPCQLLDAETATLILVRSHPIGWAADGSLAVDWRTAGTEFYDPVAGKWLAKLPRPQGQ